MSQKYQFRYQLPTGHAVERFLKEMNEKVFQNQNNEQGVFLTLAEGVALTMITQSFLNVTTKLAYEPGKQSPCYGTTLASMTLSGVRVIFPYGGEDTKKANMFFTDSPRINCFAEDASEYHISDVINSHSPFLPEHKVGRYVGTAFERASIMLDVLGHLKILNLKHNITGSYMQEFIDWVFRAANITEEEFLNQLEATHKTMTVEEHIEPYFVAAEKLFAA
jgi:hypothetical protein